MSNNLQRTSKEITDLYIEYVDMVYRICFMLLKNKSDSEDAVQSVFTKIIEKNIQFKNKDHEKASIIVMTQNHCKNILKHWWRRNITFDNNKHDSMNTDYTDDTLEQVLSLPSKYKLPIYLYYYEGYKTQEIAEMLQLNPSTLRSRLKIGREKLKLEIGGESIE